MKLKKLTRGFSLAAALLICAVSPDIAGLRAAAEPAQTIPVQRIESAQPEEPVPMIVLLQGGALDGAGTADLTNPDNLAEAEARISAQDDVFAAICGMYPEAELRCRFTTLMNGFSCIMPPSLADAVSALPEVESVQICDAIQPEPCMLSAKSLGGVPAFSEETGCTGEGTVICLIDSELDLDHPMFAPLPDGTNTKLTKDDITEIADTIGFHIDIDPDAAFISSKIPYAADYSDTDATAVVNPDENLYHGTHVAGIAAGNEFTDADGNTISGIAKNAQLVFMAVDRGLDMDDIFGYDSQWNIIKRSDRIFCDYMIEAFEDAVKLRADVISVSIGKNTIQENVQGALTRAVNAAMQAGASVCFAAGNEGELSKMKCSAEFPDHAMINNFICEGSNALAVASADNAYEAEYGVLEFDGEQILCSGYGSYEDLEADLAHYLGDSLPAGSYSYVDCGSGDPEIVSQMDLTGKIALLRRGIYRFEEMAEAAKQAGAVGGIIYNTSDDIRIVMISEADLPLALIGRSAGMKMANADDQTVTVTAERRTVRNDSYVSSYTSWGMAPSLELRPDIMGIGGMVESAAYENGTMIASGTSMASPYVAGCIALLQEHLNKTGCELTGDARQKYIRNLLMTSAVPYQENELYVSPRRQGAGLISMERALQTTVLLTGKEGESKISLRDKLGTSFRFPVTVTNTGTEDVRFSSVRLELTTDTAAYDIYEKMMLLKEQQALQFTADCSGLQEIPAGTEKTVTVSVQLDEQQAAEIRETFPCGFYIEGYLLLEGAENHADISIPVAGFSDDFFDIPLWTNLQSGITVTNGSSHAETYSLAGWQKKMEAVYNEMLDDRERDYLNRKMQNLLQCQKIIEMNQNLLKEAGLDRDTVYEKIFSPFFADFLDDLSCIDRLAPVVVSPNMDGFGDQPSVAVYTPYKLFAEGMTLRDSAGNILPAAQYKYFTEQFEGFGRYTGFSTGNSLTSFPEGDYTAELTLQRESDTDRKQVETIVQPFTIDKTAPDVRTETVTENGRKILKLNVSDKHLDSIVIVGKGQGGIAGDYQPDKKVRFGMLPLFYLKDSLKWSNCSVDADYLEALQGEPYPHYDGSAPLLRMLIEDPSALEWSEQFDFSDVIEAKPDENGRYSLSYDITDFSCYSINVLDRALNLTEIAENTTDPGVNPNKPCPLQPGVYRSLYALYEVTADTIRIVPFADPLHPHSYTYTYEYNWTYSLEPSESMLLTLDPLSAEDEKLSVTLDETADGGVHVRGIFATFLGVSGLNEETLYPTDLRSADGYVMTSPDEADMLFVQPYFAEFTGIRLPISATRKIQPDAVILYENTYYSTDGELIGTYSLTFDLKTGIAKLPDGTTRNFIAESGFIRGDTDCSGKVDVSDAVLTARMLVEDKAAKVTENGLRNSDCNMNGTLDPDDLTMMMLFIARQIVF